MFCSEEYLAFTFSSSAFNILLYNGLRTLLRLEDLLNLLNELDWKKYVEDRSGCTLRGLMQFTGAGRQKA